MEERRGAPRIFKSYTASFYIKIQPQRRCDVSRILDISRTGLKFFSFEEHPIGTEIVFQLRFPFLYPAITEVEGKVVGVDSVMSGKTWRVRVQFQNITPDTAEAFKKLEQYSKVS